MDTTSIEVAGMRLLAWADRRLQERSTIVGLCGWLGTIGLASFGGEISSHADTITALAGILSTALVTTSTQSHPLEPLLAAPAITLSATSAVADPAKYAPAPTKGTAMNFLSSVRKVLGIVAVAIAPTWNKAVADALAQAEATLVPLLGDDAKKLCEDAASTTSTGFSKLGNVVTDLAKIAADKGIKADVSVLTVIASKAYLQVVANAPALLDAAIETGITAAAGPVVGAVAAPIVEGAVASLTPAA